MRAGLPIWHFWNQNLKFRLFLKIKSTSQNLAFSFLFFFSLKPWLGQNIVWAAYSLQISSDRSLWPCRVKCSMYLINKCTTVYLQEKKLLMKILIAFYWCLWRVLILFLFGYAWFTVCVTCMPGLLSGLFWHFWDKVCLFWWTWSRVVGL